MTREKTQEMQLELDGLSSRQNPILGVGYTGTVKPHREKVKQQLLNTGKYRLSIASLI